MSAYNAPKSQPPIFDTSQFDNSEEETYLQFPVAQGIETFPSIIVNQDITLKSLGTLTLPSSSILDAYLSDNVPLKNANNFFTADNYFSKITLYEGTTDKIKYNGSSEYKTYIADLDIEGVITTRRALATRVPPEEGSIWFESGKDFVIVATVNEELSNFLYRGRSFDANTQTHFDKIFIRLTDAVQENGADADDTASYINVDYLRFFSSRIGIGQRDDPTRGNIINFYSPTLAELQISYSPINGNVIFRAGAGLINQDPGTPHDGIILFRVQASGGATQSKMRILPAGVEISNGKLYLMSGREIQLNNSNNSLFSNIFMTNDALIIENSAGVGVFIRIDTTDYVVITDSATTIYNEAHFMTDVIIENGKKILVYNADNNIHGDIYTTSTGNFVIEGAAGQSIIMRIGGAEVFTLTSGSLVLPPNSIADSALSANVVLKDSTQTLTNKTLTAPIIKPSISTTLTLPIATDTLVGRDTTDTLTNKTLTAPIIKPSITTTLTLPIATDTLVGRDTTDTLTNKTISQIKSNATTTLNFPTFGTTTTDALVSKTSTDTLTNKTLTAPIIKPTVGTTLTLPSTTDTLVGRDTIDTLTNKTINNTTLTGTLTLPSGYLVPDSNLSTNIPRLNTTNTFTQTNTFPSITFPDAAGTKLTLGTNVTIATVGGGTGLKTNVPSANSHRFSVNSTDMVQIDSSGISIASGNIAIVSGNGTKIFYNGSAGGYLIEVQTNILRQSVPTGASHMFRVNTTDLLTLSATSATCSTAVYVSNGNEIRYYDSANTAYGTIKTETQSFIITTLIYDAESHSLKIDGAEIFRIDKDPSFGTITNQFKREVNIRSGYKLVLYAPDDTAFSTLQTASDGSLRLVGASVIWRALDASGVTQSVLTATGNDLTVKCSNGLRISNSTGAYISYMNQTGIDFNIFQANDGFTNFKGVDSAGVSRNVIQFTYSTLTFGVDMTCQDINQATTKVINQTGTGSNQLKSTKITGDLEVTGGITITGANIAYLANTQTFTGTNTFDEQMTMKKSLNLPSTYVAKTGAQLGYSGAAPTVLGTTQTFTSGSTYNLAQITLNIGEYMIYGVASYNCITAATTLTSVEYSISPTSGALNGDCQIREYNPTNVVGQPIVSLNTFVSVSATATYYLVVRAVFTGGSFVRNTVSAANCRIKAVRIA